MPAAGSSSSRTGAPVAVARAICSSRSSPAPSSRGVWARSVELGEREDRPRVVRLRRARRTPAARRTLARERELDLLVRRERVERRGALERAHGTPSSTVASTRSGRLAAAVGPDQRVDLTAAQVEVEPLRIPSGSVDPAHATSRSSGGRPPGVAAVRGLARAPRSGGGARRAAAARARRHVRAQPQAGDQRRGGDHAVGRLGRDPGLGEARRPGAARPRSPRRPAAGPATGAPPPTITAANSCSAEQRRDVGGRGDPEQQREARARGGPERAGEREQRRLARRRPARPARERRLAVLAQRDGVSPRRPATQPLGDRQRRAHRSAASPTCAVGVSVSAKPK